MAVKTYDSSGVFISKKTLYTGDRVNLTYNGLLAKAGAEKIYLHLGYGDDWEDKVFIPMNFDSGLFKAEIIILEGRKLCICFKDSAENWDNNSGENYLFKISTKRAKTKKPVNKK